MSVDKKLAQARPRRLDPDHRPDPATIMAHAREAGARRPRVRRLAMVGAVPLVAAAVAGVIVLNGQSGTTPETTQAQPRSARELLLVAAERNESSPATTGRYWVLDTEYGSRVAVGPAGNRYDILLRLSSESWHATRPGDRSLAVQQHLGAAPISPADEAAWRADGSPTRWPIPKPDGSPSGKFYESTPDPRGIHGQVIATTQDTPEENVFLLGGNPVSPATLDTLPTDPAALRTWLLQLFEGSQEPEDYALFWTAKSLVLDLPVSPAVRSAAYRMMADLQDVTLLGQVTDQRGRSGLAVAYTDDGRSEYRLIIDPDTGQAFAEETRDSAGEVASYTLVLDAGYRDSEPPTE